MHSTIFVCIALLGAALGDDWKELANGLGSIQGTSFWNDTVGVIVGSEFIKRSTNAGASWTDAIISTRQTARYTDIAVSGTYVCASGIGDLNTVPGTSYSSDYATTFLRTDETHTRQQWFAVEQYGTSQGYFVKSGTWADLIGPAGNGISLSTNGGKSWTDHNWGVDCPAFCSSFPSTTTGFVAGGNAPDVFDTNVTRAVVRKTASGAWTWETILDVPNDYYITGISFTDTKNGWISCIRSGVSSLIMKTADGGVSWTTQIEIPTVKIKAIKMFNANEGFAVGGYEEGVFYHGQALHTTNGGSAWTSTNLRGYVLNSLFGYDNKHVWATAMSEANGGVVLKYLAPA